MITEKEFLEAASIIQQYQEQISNIVNNTSRIKEDLGKIKIKDWIEDNKNSMSVRLKNSLNKFIFCFPQIKFIEDIKKSDFRLILNTGNKTWFEFEDLRRDTFKSTPQP